MFYNYFLSILIGCAIKVNSGDWVALILSRKLPEKYETIVPLSIKTEVLRKCFHLQVYENAFIKLQFLWQMIKYLWYIIKDRHYGLFWLDRNTKQRLFFLSVALWVQFGTGGFRYRDRFQYCLLPNTVLKHRLSRPRWLSWMRRPTGDQEVAGSTPAEVGNILSWRLIMKYFLRSFSPFRWFKKGSCQFLAKECAQYWLTA